MKWIKNLFKWRFKPKVYVITPEEIHNQERSLFYKLDEISDKSWEMSYEDGNVVIKTTGWLLPGRRNSLVEIREIHGRFDNSQTTET